MPLARMRKPGMRLPPCVELRQQKTRGPAAALSRSSCASASTRPSGCGKCGKGTGSIIALFSSLHDTARARCARRHGGGALLRTAIADRPRPDRPVRRQRPGRPAPARRAVKTHRGHRPGHGAGKRARTRVLELLAELAGTDTPRPATDLRVLKALEFVETCRRKPPRPSCRRVGPTSGWAAAHAPSREVSLSRH